MKRLYGCLAAMLLLAGSATVAQAGGTVSIGDFRYVDKTGLDTPSEAVHRFNESEFAFLLAETLLAMTSVAVVEEHRADYRLVGRITKLNRRGDARIELAFVSRGQSWQAFDSIEDRLIFPARLTDANDAILALLEQTRDLVVSHLAPKPDFGTLETIATR